MGMIDAFSRNLLRGGNLALSVEPTGSAAANVRRPTRGTYIRLSKPLSHSLIAVVVVK